VGVAGVSCTRGGAPPSATSLDRPAWYASFYSQSFFQGCGFESGSALRELLDAYQDSGLYFLLQFFRSFKTLKNVFFLEGDQDPLWTRILYIELWDPDPHSLEMLDPDPQKRTVDS